jgi:hypothetical protein
MPIKTGEQIKEKIENGIAILEKQRQEAIEACPDYESLANGIANREKGMLNAILDDLEVHEGDKLTGLEALAGMPREEQELFLIGCTCPDLFRLQNFGDGRCEEDICGECKLKSLNATYIYHNGKLEGEK